ncbi:centrosomal protein [Caerostris darwini]|uniref:Centrosomal protein n=1 Tax=Caerostris darwini TaxID=1538125 RepID=A0AAV4SR96_9ARAC|nr:centrosomal protein [Caerostris darwini]
MSDLGLYDSPRSLEKRTLDLAAYLTSYCKGSIPRVQCLSDINSSLIVFLFENITNQNIPDLLFCTNKVEEAHNVQAVIDTMALDLLGVSLSHITGEDVVEGNLVAIYNLLEVLQGLATHIRMDKEKNQRGPMKRKMGRRKNYVPQRLSNTEDDSSYTSSARKDKRSRESTEMSQETIAELKFLRPGSPQKASSKKTDIESSSHSSLNKNLSSGYPFSDKDPTGYLSSISHSSNPRTMDFESHILSEDKRRQKSRDMTSSQQAAIEASSHLSRNKNLSSGYPSSIDHSSIPRTVDFERHISSEENNKFTFPKRDNQTSVRTENRCHFQIEKVDRNRSPVACRVLPATNIKMKRKVSKISSEKETKQTVKKEQDIEKLYENNMEQKVRVLLEKNSFYKPRAARLKKLQLQSLQKSRKTTFLPCRKSFLLPHSLRRQPVSRSATKKADIPKLKKQKLQQIHKREDEKSKSFIQEIFDEFPGVQLPSSVVNHISKKYQQHLMNLQKQIKNCLLKKPKSQLQAEEVAKRQSLLSNLLKKNINEEQYLRKSKEHKKNENAIKYRLRDARLQTAKMKKYCDEFHFEMRKKMQKRNYSKELILEKVFLDALDIQKDQVDYLCQEVKEAEENDAKQHLAYLDALENLYQTQFSMLHEAIDAEKADKKMQVNAQNQEIRNMQRAFQEELKKEIRFMQKVIVDCTEDTHFMEMDANLCTERLRKKNL